jgi:uncharacterized protein
MIAAIMKHETPAPPALGTHDGLSYALFLPEGEPVAGVVIVHGAGSAKESHFDFGRAARASDMAAITFDVRGHGRSEGRFGPGAFDDVLAMCELLREHAPAVAIRGSSMGGFQAIGAAALDPGVCAVVAICPSPPGHLLRGLRSRSLEGFECDVAACEPWLATLDLAGAARALSPTTALLLMHAQGDEHVPYTASEELFEAAGEPKRLLLLPGGHHRSLQHDLEMQGESLRFIRRAATGGFA